MIRLDALTGNGANTREVVQSELQQLHENISHKELLTICKALDDKAAIAIAVDDLRSLALNLSFDYETPPQAGEGTDQVDNIKSSGDFLAKVLLQESRGFMKHLRDFDVSSFVVSSQPIYKNAVGRSAPKVFGAAHSALTPQM